MNECNKIFSTVVEVNKIYELTNKNLWGESFSHKR